MKNIDLKTIKHFDFIDITRDVEKIVSESGIVNGICVVYVPHTTAAITINENADPAVKKDVLSFLEKAVPWYGDYTHMEGNSAAHILSTIIGVSLTIPVSKGMLSLGRWQGVFFCEFDGPRDRNVAITVMEVNL